MQKLFIRILFVSAIAVATMMTSCKKDGGGTTEEKIVGKWTAEAAYFNYFFDGVSQKDTAEVNTSNFLQFNADGTTSASDEGEIATGTWKIENNKLLITESGEQLSYDILKITKSELHLYEKEMSGEDYVEVTLHLKK